MEEVAVALEKMKAQMRLTLMSLFVTEMLPLYRAEVEKKSQIVKGECVKCFFHALGDHLWPKLDRDPLSSTWSNLVSSYKVSEGFLFVGCLLVA